MKNRQRIAITQTQFTEMLKSLSACSFFSMRALTEAQKSKAKGAKVILKESFISGLVHWDYQNSVNNELAREGKESEFKANPLPAWKERLSLSLYRHKGNGTLYVGVKVQKALNSPRFYMDGKEVTKEEIAHLIRPPSESKRQADAGVEKPVIYRDFKFDSIREFNLNGKRYVIQ